MFFYTDDDGLLVGMRQGDYKYVLPNSAQGTMEVWAEPFKAARLRHDGRSIQVRSHVQGVSAAIVPAQLQSGNRPRTDIAQIKAVRALHELKEEKVLAAKAAAKAATAK